MTEKIYPGVFVVIPKTNNQYSTVTPKVELYENSDDAYRREVEYAITKLDEAGEDLMSTVLQTLMNHAPMDAWHILANRMGYEDIAFDYFAFVESLIMIPDSKREQKEEEA